MISMRALVATPRSSVAMRASAANFFDLPLASLATTYSPAS
jgi:hypothetical protein